VTARARLIPTHEPRDPAGLVLVLHGGAARGEAMMVSPTQLSVLRMVPVAKRLALAGRGRLSVYRLLNSARGWDAKRTPVQDVDWALARLHERFGDLPPVALVGHSLGGRAALLAAARPEVRSVVALNPWVYPSDGDLDATGRRVLVVHGTDDRVALPERAEAAARRLARTARVGFISVEGARHAMLRHGQRFERYAADFVTATLLGDTPRGPVADVLDGRHRVDV
jgi:pimeloyl-ACP methyl ester carboxylesterase